MDPLARLAGHRTLRKLLGRPFLLTSGLLWRGIPPALQAWAPFHAYGRLIQRLVRLRDQPFRSEFTRFMRNRPLYEKLCELVAASSFERPVRVAIMGCSTGAEVFSLGWLLSERWGVPRTILGMDISDKVLSLCREARYQPIDQVLEGLSSAEIAALFDARDGCLQVKDSIRSGITWRHCDVRDPQLRQAIGPQHVVVANNVLIHLSSDNAELCLRSLAGLVAEGGYLCVSGVNLDLKARVARDLRLKPISSGIRGAHHGYRAIHDEWPWTYWGLEPYRRDHPDHDYRYAMLFQGPGGPGGRSVTASGPVWHDSKARGCAGH